MSNSFAQKKGTGFQSLGRKPKVALNSEAAAKANIQAKLRLIVDLNKNASTTAEFSAAYRGAAPLTVRQFNNWEISDDALGIKVKKNANDTLKRYPDLLLSVQQGIAQLRTTRDEALSKPTKEHRISSLRSQGQLHKVLRKIAERELIMARREVIESKASLAKVEGQLRALTQEAAKLLSDARADADTLRKELAQMTEAWKKIRPLKNVGTI